MAGRQAGRPGEPTGCLRGVVAFTVRVGACYTGRTVGGTVRPVACRAGSPGALGPTPPLLIQQQPTARLPPNPPSPQFMTPTSPSDMIDPQPSNTPQSACKQSRRRTVIQRAGLPGAPERTKEVPGRANMPHSAPRLELQRSQEDCPCILHATREEASAPAGNMITTIPCAAHRLKTPRKPPLADKM